MTLNLIGIARSRGASVDLSSPPPIGDVAPNTGAFTTLTSTGDVRFGAAGASAARLNVNAAASSIGLIVRNHATTPDNPIVVQDSSGNTILLINNVGGVVSAQDTDRTSIFGRVRLDSRSSDVAFLSHHDMTGGGQYALRQSATGQTTLNSASGFAVAFAINGSNIGVISSVGLRAGDGGSPSAPLHGVVNDAATNTVSNALILAHETSGTPAASYGTGLLIQGESSTTSNRDMARIRSLWTTATDAARVSQLILSAYNVGSEVDVLKLTVNGSAPVVQINSTSTNSALSVVGASPTHTRAITGAIDAVTTDAAYVGVEGSARVLLNAASSAFIGGNFALNYNGTTGLNQGLTSTALFAGVGGNVGSGGTVSFAHGVLVNLSKSGVGTITNMYGFRLFQLANSAGTLTNAYGLYLADVNVASTLNYAIFTNAGLVRFGGNVVLADVDIQLGTTTGTKIGTATTQKLSLWNVAPDVQPTTAIAAATFVANSSGIADDTATWGGYTAGQIVSALKRIGALA